MMTPEKKDPAGNEVVPLVDDPEVSNVSVDAYHDEDAPSVMDIENQQPKVDAPADSNTSIFDNNTNSVISNMNNTTINDSMTSENCKIINESDSSPQQRCPVSPSELADMNGSNNQNSMIPESPNLTPVKLDADLLKQEQETVTSSPTYSRDPNMMSMDDSKDEPDDDDATPISRRQRRMRVLKCYAFVAIVVLICGIGVPIGAVFLFKNKNEETSFESSAISNPTMSDTVEVTDVPETPEVVDEAPETVVEEPVVAVPVPDPEDTIAVVEDEFVVTEEDNSESDTAAEPWAVLMDSSINITLGEKNVTSVETFPDDAEEEETEAPTEPAGEEVGEVTDAPSTSVPTSSPITSTPTYPPTDAPTIRLTVAPTVKATRPPGPDRSPLYFELVNVTSPEILQDTSSAQALSFLWLVEQDQMLPLPTGPKLLQRYSMVLLDHSLHYPMRAVHSQAELDECEWTGIVCDEETGEVLQINWERKGMNGQLVEEMRHLTRLERLDLSNNELVGDLEYIYEVKSLKELFLNNNKFSGILSEQVGLLRSLEKLYLGYNELEGNIPISLRSSVEDSKPLRWLVLSHNKFTGYIPPDWRMRNLFYLDLGYNFLSGPLPNDWQRNMVRLRHLYLDHNSFTGNIPSYFSDLGNGRIKQINLNSNFLEGEVPFIWETKDQVIALNFQDNNITTPLDPRVCELSTFEQGAMVEMRVDCPICTCDTLCHMCG